MVLFSNRYLRFDTEEPTGPRLPLLWPVLVWRVIYPPPMNTELNIFQRTVLRLSQAGCSTAREQAQVMGLSKDLVAFVAKELIDRNLMEESGKVTPNGSKALRGDEVPSGSLNVGYAFQDAVSGSLMPRFSESLPEFEPDEEGTGPWPRFLMSKESGRQIQPFCVPGQLHHGAPTPQRLLEAYARYRRHHRQRELGETFGDDVAPPRVRIGSIESLAAEPQRLQLLIWVLPDELDGWLVQDPFCMLDTAPWLRLSLLTALPTTPGLAKALERVIKPPEQAAAGEMDIASVAARVELEMLSRKWTGLAKEVAEQLELVLRRSYQVSAANSPMPEDVNSLTVEVQKLGEAALKWCLNRWPVDRRRLPRREEMLEKGSAWWTDFYCQLGLPGMSNEAADRLAQQRWTDVEAALRSGKRSLKALAAATVLACVEHQDHPFWKLGPERLRLDRLFKIADERNTVGHFTGKNSSATSALDASAFMVDWCDDLIGTGIRK